MINVIHQSWHFGLAAEHFKSQAEKTIPKDGLEERGANASSLHLTCKSM